MLHGKCPKYTTKNMRINIGPAMMVVIFVSTSQSHFHLQCSADCYTRRSPIHHISATDDSRDNIRLGSEISHGKEGVH